MLCQFEFNFFALVSRCLSRPDFLYGAFFTTSFHNQSHDMIAVGNGKYKDIFPHGTVIATILPFFVVVPARLDSREFDLTILCNPFVYEYVLI